MHLPGSCATSGPELVLAGLVKQLHAHTITLEDANIVARLVTDGTSARQQASQLYMSPRVAQRRVHTVATRLLANAVNPGDPVRQVWCRGRLTFGASA